MEISLVGMLDISLNTKFEKPRVAGKHLMRHANNDYAAVACIVNLLRGPPSLGRQRLPRLLIKLRMGY